MKKQRFTETQIASILKQYDGGREYGISKATLYNWRKKYAGMDSSHIKAMKALQDENRRLKQMYAELMLDHQLAKHIIEKKVVTPCHKKELAEQVIKGGLGSVDRAYRVIHLQRSLWHYCRGK